MPDYIFLGTPNYNYDDSNFFDECGEKMTVFLGFLMNGVGTIF